MGGDVAGQQGAASDQGGQSTRGDDASDGVHFAGLIASGGSLSTQSLDLGRAAGGRSRGLQQGRVRSCIRAAGVNPMLLSCAR
jgi:hypothetical protein